MFGAKLVYVQCLYSVRFSHDHQKWLLKDAVTLVAVLLSTIRGHETHEETTGVGKHLMACRTVR